MWQDTRYLYIIRLPLLNPCNPRTTHDISHSDENTVVFRVAGATNIDWPVIIFSFFSSVGGKVTEKTGYRNVRPFRSFYLSSLKVTTVSFYTWGESVFLTV